MDGATPISLEEPGFYELRDQRTGERGALVAVNVDPVEASLEPFDPAELVTTVASREVASAPGEAAPLTLQERERQQSAWWYLMVLVFLILAAETVMSNRFYRAATPTRG